VAASTWNRELALVNGFFGWAAGQRLIPANPVPQRARRAAADRRRHGEGGVLVPAAQARDTGRDEVQWLTPAEYRWWRDAGLRGYRADGLPDAGFWAAGGKTRVKLAGPASPAGSWPGSWPRPARMVSRRAAVSTKRNGCCIGTAMAVLR
jgi:hypothetical protein